MNKSKSKRLNRITRHKRVRANISGTAKRPRVTVFKSNQFIYAQVIDDESRHTLGRVSDNSKKNTKPIKSNKVSRAEAAGGVLAEALIKKGIKEAVFDRGGFKYHGRIKAFVEGLRKGGLKI